MTKTSIRPEGSDSIEKQGSINRIAVVDVNRVVAQSAQVQTLKSEQAQKSQELQQWLNSVKAEVDSKQTNEEKQKLVTAYNQEFTKRQEIIRADYTQKLQMIEKSINETISEEAKNQGYDIVLAKHFVLFGGDDITDDVAKIVK
jgi:Skp family chaperone for outer membrane proteins